MNNEHELKHIIDAIKNISKPVEWHLLTFNYNENNPLECDNILFDKLTAELGELGQSPNIIRPFLKTPLEMLNYIKNDIDILVGMRYHAIAFALITGKRVIPIISSSKTEKISYDHNLEPIEIKDISYVINRYYFSNEQINSDIFSNINSNIFSDIRNIITSQKRRHIIPFYITLPFEVLLQKCIVSLSRYFNISIDDANEIIRKQAKFNTYGKRPLDVAYFIIYILTGCMNHPCLWGLLENMSHEDFCLYDAMYFIWNIHRGSEGSEGSEGSGCGREIYLPKTKCVRRCFVMLNDSENFREYHRAGWAYTIGGLYDLDCNTFYRHIHGNHIFIDTYVDRTFHWGFDTQKTIGTIPYKNAWIGFIHHTFDETHSYYNCRNLLRNPLFIESLKYCKALIVLSKSLRSQLIYNLSKLGIYDTIIHVLYHPTEFVSNTFSMHEFIKNKEIVQIGAWLRNPYGIYQLNTKLKKKALKGKDMTLYFPPDDYIKRISRLYIGDGDGSRDEVLKKIFCRDSSYNKFCIGAVEMLINHVQSVEIISHLDNDKYDELLSRTIVFLNLVDCSAVNTVVECIVRNTPVIVNRLDALEEVLGVNYPGFYETLNDAQNICNDIYKISEIHEYMKLLDKSRYKLDHSVNEFQKIVLGEHIDIQYSLFQPIRPLTYKFRLQKFLGRSFLP